jgi:hypothetical protein
MIFVSEEILHLKIFWYEDIHCEHFPFLTPNDRYKKD